MQLSFSNAFQHPKTTVIGLLVAITIACPIIAGVDWKHVTVPTICGLLVSLATAFLGILMRDPKKPSNGTDTQQLGAFALIALLLAGSFGTVGCNGTSVAQNIVNWTPTIISTANTVGATVSILAPQDAAIIGIATAGFDAAATLLQKQAETYLANPGATALQQLQAQALTFQQNVNASLLQAAKIVNPESQQNVIVAIQSLATGLTAVLGLIATIKGSTITPAAVTQVKIAQVMPLMDRNRSIALVAAHYGEPRFMAAYQVDSTVQQLQALGL